MDLPVESLYWTDSAIPNEHEDLMRDLDELIGAFH
jgi:hypothetical protein